jgi:hypothetical protein
MKVVKTVDAKGACCMDTLATPIKEAFATIEDDESIEVIVRPGFEKMVHRFAQDEGYLILEERKGEDEIRFTIARKEAARKKENCMICGGPLEYLTEPVSVICLYCGREEKGYVRCPEGHYVCEVCHGKGAYEAIKDIALSSSLKDPLAIAEVMMSHPNIPMLGCENALVSAAAFMTALKNRGHPGIEDKHIIEAMDRTQRQSISAYCGLTGVCGVPVSIGAVFSVILGAECPKDKETAITMRTVARVVDAVANETGPCCCKSYVWTGLTVGCGLAKEYLNIKLPIHRERIVCSYFKRHPHGCRGAKCGYFPKRGLLSKSKWEGERDS